VEPAIGSTPGLPDCWVPVGDRCLHLELKLGSIGGGMLRYTVRPEQAKQIAALKADSVPVGLLIGIKGTHTVIFARAMPLVLAGKWSLVGDWWPPMWRSFDVREVGGFQHGVNFIFSSLLESWGAGLV